MILSLHGRSTCVQGGLRMSNLTSESMHVEILHESAAERSSLFPRTLGSGAFGQVVEATAHGLSHSPGYHESGREDAGEA